jgi:uncharacterized protein (UPF0248 family)
MKDILNRLKLHPREPYYSVVKRFLPLGAEDNDK